MSWLPQLHLRTKLVGSIVLTSVIAVLATSFAFVQYDRNQETATVSEDMKMLASIIANRSTAALIFGDARQAESNLKALGENPNVVMACIYDSGNDVFSYHHFTHLDQQPCPKNPKQSALTIGDSIEIYEPIELDNLLIGTLYMNVSLDWLSKRWREQITYIFYVVFMVLVAAIIVAKYLQMLLVRPIQQIASTARNITEQKDYSLRAKKGVKDELGDMVDVFNTMLSKIEEETESLYSSEEKFRQLSSLAPVGIFQINLENQITYVNNRWVEITGINQPLVNLEHWLGLIRMGDRRRTLKAWSELAQDHKPFVVEVGFEQEDNTITWSIIEASVLYDSKGVIYGYMGALSDITDLKNAQL